MCEKCNIIMDLIKTINVKDATHISYTEIIFILSKHEGLNNITEVGRFISPDDLCYLDPETIGGLNLYSDCLNNSVMCIMRGGQKHLKT